MNKNMPEEVNIQGCVDGIGHAASMSSVSLISSFHFNGVLGNEHAGGSPEALAAHISSQR